MGHPSAGKFKPGENSPDVAEKWAAALNLRKAGVSFDRIARELGYANASGAYDAVMGALKATLREPAESVRTLEVERLDRLMAGIWTRAAGGDSEAIDRVLKIMDRRARLLGLDAPVKVAPTNPDGTEEYTAMTPDQKAARVAEIMADAQARQARAAGNDG